MAKNAFGRVLERKPEEAHTQAATTARNAGNAAFEGQSSLRPRESAGLGPIRLSKSKAERYASWRAKRPPPGNAARRRKKWRR